MHLVDIKYVVLLTLAFDLSFMLVTAYGPACTLCSATLVCSAIRLEVTFKVHLLCEHLQLCDLELLFLTCDMKP